MVVVCGQGKDIVLVKGKVRKEMKEVNELKS